MAENKTIEVSANPENVAVFEDKKVRLIVPNGWKEVESESSPYYLQTTTLLAKFTKRKSLKLINNMGDQVWIRRDRYDSENPRDDANIIEELIQYAPIHQHIKTYTIKGSQKPHVIMHVWRAFHIKKGKKVPFKVFAAYRPVPVLNPMKGIAKIFGISATADFNNETEMDILKMAELLDTYKESKEKDEKKKKQVTTSKKKKMTKKEKKAWSDSLAKKVVENIKKRGKNKKSNRTKN